MEKNGNKSAVQGDPQPIEGANFSSEYKANRLSVAPMMDCPLVVEKSHRVKWLRA